VQYVLTFKITRVKTLNENAAPPLPRPFNPHFASIATQSTQHSPVAPAVASPSPTTQNFTLFTPASQNAIQTDLWLLTTFDLQSSELTFFLLDSQ
jgi:hypothetical protein